MSSRAGSPDFGDVVARLKKAYGVPRPPPSDPFELIVRENAAYLVDDPTREAVFQSLKRAVGATPKLILEAPFGKIVAAIRNGGMRPEDRARKVVDCARIADEIGLVALRALAAKGGPEARKALKRFPGIGDPGADRLLLFCGGAGTGLGNLAPESNGLRVLVRLGFGREDRNYSKTYREANEAVQPELPASPAARIAAHQLLRRHGQELCRRTEPRCDICPLASICAFAAG